MRVLFTFIGGLGHFDPLEPIARAAAAAGHDVAVACSGGLIARMAEAGFVALPTSPARPQSMRPRDLTPLGPVDVRATENEFAENFADKGARRHASAIREHLSAWAPDVIVRDEADFGSAIAAEVMGVPVATVLVLASGLLIRPDLVTEPLAALRAEHGLPPDPRLSMLTRDLVLTPSPPSFRSPDSPVALPADTFAFRAHSHHVSRISPTPAGTRRVYVTLGTVFNTGAGDLFERLLAGLADVDAEILMTVGRDIDPRDLGPHADHIRIEGFVPQASVLPAVDLVISHGGSGTLLATLAHGLPSILLPLGADQPHNAGRASALGLARTLDAATADPQTIGSAVTEALGDRAARERTHRVAQEIGALPGVEETLPLLERLCR